MMTVVWSWHQLGSVCMKRQWNSSCRVSCSRRVPTALRTSGDRCRTCMQDYKRIAGALSMPRLLVMLPTTSPCFISCQCLQHLVHWYARHTLCGEQLLRAQLGHDRRHRELAGKCRLRLDERLEALLALRLPGVITFKRQLLLGHLQYVMMVPSGYHQAHEKLPLNVQMHWRGSSSSTTRCSWELCTFHISSGNRATSAR